MPFKSEDARKAWEKEYYLRNKERKNKQSRAWREANPGAHRAMCEDWKRRNPDKIRESGRRTSSTRRARIANVFVEVVDPETVFSRDSGVCQICLLPIGGSDWHVDHVQPIVFGGEHSYANTQLAHAHCNLVKWAKV